MDQERRGYQIVVSSGQPDAHGSRPVGKFGGVKAILLGLLALSLFIGFLLAAVVIGSIVAIVLVVLAGVATMIALVRAVFRSARSR